MEYWVAYHSNDIHYVDKEFVILRSHQLRGAPTQLHLAALLVTQPLVIPHLIDQGNEGYFIDHGLGYTFPQQVHCSDQFHVSNVMAQTYRSDDLSIWEHKQWYFIAQSIFSIIIIYNNLPDKSP